MIFNKIKDLREKVVGMTFSTFDLLHAGHIAMLADAKRYKRNQEQLKQSTKQSKIKPDIASAWMFNPC